MASVKIYVAAIAAIKRILEYTNQPAFQQADRTDLMIRLERLEEAWVHLTDIHDKVLGGKGQDVEKTEEELAKAEEIYCSAKAILRRQLAKATQYESEQPTASLASTADSQPQPPVAVQVQLPAQQQEIRNSWGEFDGSLTKWQGFHDRFVSAIHENDSVSPAYKFTYLSKSLTGKAAATMGEWQLTDKNYQEAWERLNQLYNKKYQTCRELLRQFTQLPSLAMYPNADDLQHLSNVTHEMLRQLKAQGLPVEHWDMFVVPMIHDLLDSATARQWELQRSSETPTSKEMLEFLDKQAAASSSEVNPRRASTSTARFNRFENERSSQPPRTVDLSATRKVKSTASIQPARSAAQESSKPSTRFHNCELCKERHQLYNCQNFKALNLRARREYVKANNLCENCIKRGHHVDTCYQDPCPRCPYQQMHNSALCPIIEDRKQTAAMAVVPSKIGKRKND